MATQAIRKMGITVKDRIYMRCANFTFRVRQGEFSEDRSITEAKDMGVDPIWIGFVKRKGRFFIELTGMTGEELALFRQGMIAALDAAEQVVKYLDQQAIDEFDIEDADVIPLRAIRTAPPVVMRSIDPFAGSEIQPFKSDADKRAYLNEFDQTEIPR